jgi:putative inorganic carbon (hco3(-)) transporter
VRDVGLSSLAKPRGGDANVRLWAARIAGGAAAFAAGTALGHVEQPVLVALLAVLAALAVALAAVHPRWFLMAVLFLLPAYIPDAFGSPRFAYFLTALALAAAVLPRVMGRERFQVPHELLAFAALVLAFGIATLFATDRSAAFGETLDLISFTAVVALLIVLLDTPAWMRRAAWALVAGTGLLAALAILQQLTGNFSSTYGGLATVLADGDSVRSAGPLNPNTFGQVLATSAVLAFYLAYTETRRAGRLLAGAIAVACTAGVVYSQSRAALAALAIGALAIGALRGVRLRVLALAATAAVLLGLLLLPQSLTQRVGALADIVTTDPVALQDTALRGRAAENLAALRMWRDNPLVGVGPDNFEIRYQGYSAAIGIDPRPQERGAHNLYLESLAETGFLGALALFAILGLALTGAWRARKRLEGRDALLGEGLFVALGVFLIAALTLNSAYARYQWIFIGLGLAAGRLARKPAP